VLSLIKNKINKNQKGDELLSELEKKNFDPENQMAMMNIENFKNKINKDIQLENDKYIKLENEIEIFITESIDFDDIVFVPKLSKHIIHYELKC